MKKMRVFSHNIGALFRIHFKKIYLHNKPTHIWIEPTNYCNLKCIMCPTGRDIVSVKKGYMDFDLYRALIDQIKDFASSITLAVNGESLLHPCFTDMVEYAKTKKIKVSLNTNATLLTHEKSLKLLNANIDYISFAFDGINKSMYEKARIGANFEKTLENILTFLRLKKQYHFKRPYTVLSMLMLELEKFSEEEKNIFIQKFDNLIDEIRLREVATWGATFKDSKDFSHREHAGNYLPCSRLWSTACISWNGDVLPCIYNANHEYVMGNIRDNKFLEIWNGDKALKLRQSMIDGHYLEVSPLCNNCIVIGTPPIMGIPSGIRFTLSDALINFLGYRFEKYALLFANKIRKGAFSSRTIKD